MSYANYSISFSNEFEIFRIALYGVIGAFAIPSNILFMYLTVRQSSVLSSEYVKVLLTLKILQLFYDLQTCLLFIIAPVFPCKGIFLKGAGTYLRLNAHIPFVLHLTTLCMLSAWFNCCLFHRHQVILPFDHKLKLQPRGVYGVYLIINIVMVVNPLSFIFTAKNDEEAQRSVVAISPMAWLLAVPSFKIYTDDNCPLIMSFHFPLMLTTFVLCTITTTLLTSHATKIMNTRKNQISAATILLQQRLINSLQFQMNVATFGMGIPSVYWTFNLLIGFELPMYAIVSTKPSVDFILRVLRIRKPSPTVNPIVSLTTAFVITPVNYNSRIRQKRRC